MPTPSDLPDRPVFVDPSGRRRRIVRRLAIAGCTLLATYAVLLCAALSGAPIPPSALLPLPGTPATTESTTTTDLQPAAATSTTGRPNRATTTSSTTRPTLTAQPVTGPTVTTTSTTGNRNSHAPTTPPGRTKHTDTTTPTP
jgi:cytoskeletal protein RodZ